MSINEFYDKYPLSMGKLESTIELLQGIDPPGRRVVINALLISNPRSLYGLFDSEDIIIGIYPERGEFSYDIVERDGDFSGEFKTRAEAEGNAFAKAFEILEEKLTKNGTV